MGEHLPQERLEAFEAVAFVIRVKTGLIPALAECSAAVKARVVAIPITGVFVPVVVFGVVDYLEDVVMFHGPRDLPTDKGADHLG